MRCTPRCEVGLEDQVQLRETSGGRFYFKNKKKKKKKNTNNDEQRKRRNHSVTIDPRVEMAFFT